jgi:formylglycine-generating enzyme required for sulfatase activity
LFCRSACRQAADPATRNGNFGFRVVLDAVLPRADR